MFDEYEKTGDISAGPTRLHTVSKALLLTLITRTMYDSISGRKR